MNTQELREIRCKFCNRRIHLYTNRHVEYCSPYCSKNGNYLTELKRLGKDYLIPQRLEMMKEIRAASTDLEPVIHGSTPHQKKKYNNLKDKIAYGRAHGLTYAQMQMQETLKMVGGVRL